MVSPIVYVDYQGAGLGRNDLGLLSHVAASGLRPTVAAFGNLDPQACIELVRHGAAKVIMAQGEATPANAAAFMAGLVDARRHNALLASTTSFSCEMAAAVAAAIGAGIWWDLVDLKFSGDEMTGWRDADCGERRVEAHWVSKCRIALVRPGQFSPAAVQSGDEAVELVRLDMPAAPRSWKLVDAERAAQAGASRLASASVIVAAGRGIGRQENMALVEALASTLGAAVGVSLPLVDLGWASRDKQVGQTGTVVKPRLYVACGISGQIQHRIGIEQSETIVAINKDETAPIMRFCDLAIVGDLETVLPLIVEALRRRRGSVAEPGRG